MFLLVGTELEEGLPPVVLVVVEGAVVQESKGLAVHQWTALQRPLSARNTATVNAVRIRLEELLAVQASELVGAAVDPMIRAPAAAPLTALTRRRCAVNMDTASVPLTRLEALPVDLELVDNNIRLGLCHREEQEDTAKEEEEHSLATRIRPGVNLGAQDSTKGLDSAMGQTRVPDSIRDRVQVSVGVQTRALARVQIQTTTEAPVDQTTTTMATQLLPHPVLMLS